MSLLQVVQANMGVLEAMQVNFLGICIAAAEHAGLPGVGPSMVEWGESVAVQDLGFTERLSNSKKDQTAAKEELLHVWGLRAQQLCPYMEQAARAAVRAELAPLPGVNALPEFSERQLVSAHAPIAGAMKAAAMEAVQAPAQIGVERMALAAEVLAQVEAEAVAEAKGDGLAEYAATVSAEAAKFGNDSEQGQQLLTAALERLQDLIVEEAAGVEAAQLAAAEEGEGGPGKCAANALLIQGRGAIFQATP